MRVVVVLALIATTAAAAPTVSIKAHTDVRLSPVHKDEDGNYVVSGQLVDRLTGQGIGGYHLKVTLGGRSVSATTDKDGAFEAPVPAPGGVTDLAVDFAGGASLDAAHVVQKDVDVDKAPLDLHLTVAPTPNGAQVTVTATTPGPAGAAGPDGSLTRGGNDEPRKVNVRVSIAAGAADASTIPEVGQVTAGGPPLAITRAMAGGAGRRKVRARFAGDDVYAPASADATFEITTATTTRFALDDDSVAFEDDVTGTGMIADDDGHGIPHASVAILSGDRHVAEAETDAQGAFKVTIEAQAFARDGQTVKAGTYAVQAVLETTTGWLKPSRSAPVTLTIAAPQPVPVAWTMIAAIATGCAMMGFFAARSKPWARWIKHPAAAAPPPPARAAEPVAGLVLSRPGLVNTLRRPHDHGFTGAVRDAVRDRPIAGAVLEMRLGAERRTATTAGDGTFAFEDLPPGEWDVACGAPGHVTERFGATIPHRGELRDARVDLVPVRERVFSLYRRAALPLLPDAALWGVWSPRQVVDHVRGSRPAPALADLTDFVEETYFSARTPDEGILPDAQARVEAAVREHSLV